MALNFNALCTVDDVKAFVDIKKSDYDVIIEQQINGFSDFVEQYCRRFFKKRRYVEYLTGSGSNTLVLSMFPVSNVEVRYDNNREFTDNTILDSSTYIVYERTGELYLKDGIWDNGVDNNYKITYDVGYDTVPASLQALAVQIVGTIVLRGMRKQTNVNTMTFNNNIIRYEDILTDAQWKILNSYRRKII